MNIWILNQHALPEGAAGGTRHAVLAKYLHRRGHSVTIFASDLRHTGGKAISGRTTVDGMQRESPGKRSVAWRFVEVGGYTSAFTRLLSMRRFRSRAIAASEGLPRPDVVIGSCVHPYAVDAGRRLARRHRVPFVYEIRDIWPASLVDVGALTRWNPIYWEFRKLELRAFRNAQGVIGVCPGMKGYATQHDLPAGRFLYAPNGIDPEVYSEPGPPRDSNPFIVSYLGSQGPVNGLMTLVEAARRLQERSVGDSLRIRLVGDGTERTRLQRQAAEWDLRNIEFHDSVAKSEVVTMCQESDAFVYCHRSMPVVARYGVSANKIFDYLAAARPVVFSCDSLNDPVRDAEAGLSVPAGDAGLLADAMEEISRLPLQERQRLGTNGRAYVLKHHNLELIAEQCESFLYEISDIYRCAKRRVA